MGKEKKLGVKIRVINISLVIKMPADFENCIGVTEECVVTILVGGANLVAITARCAYFV